MAFKCKASDPVSHFIYFICDRDRRSENTVLTVGDRLEQNGVMEINLLLKFKPSVITGRFPLNLRKNLSKKKNMLILGIEAGFHKITTSCFIR